MVTSIIVKIMEIVFFVIFALWYVLSEVTKARNIAELRETSNEIVTEIETLDDTLDNVKKEMEVVAALSDGQKEHDIMLAQVLAELERLREKNTDLEVVLRRTTFDFTSLMVKYTELLQRLELVENELESDNDDDSSSTSTESTEVDTRPAYQWLEEQFFTGPRTRAKARQIRKSRIDELCEDYNLAIHHSLEEKVDMLADMMVHRAEFNYKHGFNDTDVLNGLDSEAVAEWINEHLEK